MTHTATPSPFTLPLRVYWEDTDAGGIVYYANYLKFFERARTEWLRTRDIRQLTLQDEAGGVFVASEAAIKYHRPARLDDALTITAQLQHLGRASAVFFQQAWRGGLQGELLAEATVRVGWVNAHTMRPEKMPGRVWRSLQGGQA